MRVIDFIILICKYKHQTDIIGTLVPIYVNINTVYIFVSI
jgi:hypothetical protein